MTTGSYGSLPPTLLTEGSYSKKAWNGADGKYETYAGKRRIKWNNLSLDAELEQCTSQVFRLSGKRVLGGAYYEGDYRPVIASTAWAGLTPTGVTSTDKNRVLQKILQKVKGHDFNLAVELGQMNQTVDLLSSNLRKLGRAALSLRHGQFDEAARWLGARPRNTKLRASDVSGRWLELQYGWLPLLGSSFDAAKAFEALSNGPRSVQFVASVKVPFVAENSQSPSSFSCKCFGQHLYRLQFELYEELNAARQMGLSDPFQVAWELVPWSFVIDWFLPIGTYLSNFYNIPFLKGRWLETTARLVPRQYPKFTFLKEGQNFTIGSVSVTNCHMIRPPNVNRKSALVSRIPLSGPPLIPFPKFNFSGINSSRRLWNAIALGQQRFGRKVPPGTYGPEN
jgi:hypothetical protein